MATGEKISAQAVATTWSGSDLATIVQSGVNKSITHDVFMDDTQICKAWVNFNGTGTVAIRDSYNVSSITDDGTGIYTVNFIDNMSSTDYAVFGMTSVYDRFVHTTAQAVDSAVVRIRGYTGTYYDDTYVSVAIFGD